MTRQLHKWTHLFIFGLILCPLCSHGSPVLMPEGAERDAIYEVADASNADLRLKKIISMEASGEPLKAILARITKLSGVSLSVTATLGEQRVILRVIEKPLWRVMGRLQCLIDHRASHPKGHYWLREGAGDKSAYRLTRNRRGDADEKAALDFPRQRTIAILKQMRASAALTEEERVNFAGDAPKGLIRGRDASVFRSALRDLTDEELDRLSKGEKIPLSPSRFADRIGAAAANKEAIDAETRANFARNGESVPEELLLPLPPPSIYLTPADDHGENPLWSDLTGIHLEGMASSPDGSFGDFSYVIDPFFDNALWESATKKDAKNDKDPTLHLKGSGKTDGVSKSGLAILILRMAEAAKKDVYVEYFVRHSFRSGNTAMARPVATGTLPEMLRAIRWEWNYESVKSDEDYLLWSKSWARDRQADIPEKRLDEIRKRIRRQGGLTFDDLTEYASHYSWPQLRQTMWAAVPEAGGWLPQAATSALQFHTRLTPGQREAILSPNGLGVANLDARTKEELVSTLPPSAAIRFQNPGSLIMRSLVTTQSVGVTQICVRYDFQIWDEKTKIFSTSQQYPVYTRTPSSQRNQTNGYRKG